MKCDLGCRLSVVSSQVGNLRIGVLIFSLIFVCIYFQNCKDTPFMHGKIMYENFCESCHMADGMGLEGVIPPLAGADYVQNNQSKLACIIRKGQTGKVIVNGREYNQEMAGVPQLSDFEITNVINYINSAWGNDFGYMKITDVKKALEECPIYE